MRASNGMADSEGVEGTKAASSTIPGIRSPVGVAQITSVLDTAPPPPLTGRPPLGAWPTAAGHLDQEAAKLADLHASGLREWPKQQLQPPSTARLDHPPRLAEVTAVH